MRARFAGALLGLVLIVATIGGAVVLLVPGPDDVAEAAGCAPGFLPVERALDEVRAEGAEGDELAREAVAELPMLADVPREDWDRTCVRKTRPESLKELIALFGARAIPRLAPYGTYAKGAPQHASAQRRAMSTSDVAAAKGKGASYGTGPLIVDDPRYPEVNGLGLSHNSGRVDSFAWVPSADRLFAAVGNGGIWRSDNLGASWKNATGDLPTSVTGAVAWTPAHQGTLLALTGEPTFGASAYTGLGAYWSGDLGKHWQRSPGLPTGGLGFALAVDPTNAKEVYAATQLGLFRSTDGGRSYTNVDLPTGKCAGVTNVDKHPECALANVVTDVVLAKGGGKGTSTKAGTVLATVGWRGGNRTNPDGSVQSPKNGVYRSTSGKVGSFKKLDAGGFAAQDHIGRVELGNAVGPGQDHDFLYALVQDAKLLNNGGVAGIDAPDGQKSPVGSTVLNGLYVSPDFGTTWTRLVSGSELTADPASGSALVGTGTATGYQPGVQGWYNLWVQPDPTRATSAGVPTRLGFGLEEIWTNELTQTGAPLDGSVPTHFRVVGKYFGGDSCLLLSAGLPTCPGDREPDDSNQTTHPDQQDGIWIRDKSIPGGVQLVVGNDGGVYRYRFESDDDGELDNSHWGKGDNDGFSTLMPYYAAMAKDGTVWAGLQDNGNMRIEPGTGKRYETYGGDGFFAAVDPDDSDTAYEEYTNGAISVTTDGGTSWKDIDPGLTASKFSNPFAMDPTDADHLITAGREVVETLSGSATSSGQTAAASADSTTTTWRTVFNLGTRSHPGDASATSGATDPDNSMSAVGTTGNASYVGFCGHCDTLNKLGPDKTLFRNGLATNVGGTARGAKGSAAGWHIVAAKGLPNRYITSVAIDPHNSSRVFVTLGGYTRRWLPPGAVGDANKQIGEGHLFRSTDGGRTFVDVTGNLPDSPATWVALRGGQLLVATDVGAFASNPKAISDSTPTFAPLADVPAAPVSSIALKPGNPNRAVLAVFGRGVWTYDFDQRLPLPPDTGPAPLPQVGSAFASYDFEADAQGWTSSGLPPWQLGSPGHGDAAADDGAGHAWAVSGPTGYADNADTTLDSPAITATAGAAAIEWWMKLDTEGGFDQVSVEWSKDGSSWQTLGSFSGANDAPGWQRYAVPFTAPAGQVHVRFHFISDSLCSALGGPLCSSTSGWDGVHVDDVVVGAATP